MDDLISRQAAVGEIKQYINHLRHIDKRRIKVFDAMLMDIKAILEQLPSAQPETGRWIPVGDSGVAVRFYKCSRCGYLAMGSGRKYCEDCGAKMEVEP